MQKPIFCPNPECVHHAYHLEGKQSNWYSKDGFYQTKAHGRIQRFKCRACKTRFSTQTFSIHYYAKKIVDPKKILRGLVSTSSLSDLSRDLNVSVHTIINRQNRMAKQAVGLHSRMMSHITINEPYVCDGFQSVCVNFYYPNNINIAVGQESQFFYSFTHVTIKRGGKLTPEQIQLRDEYEARWSPAAGSLGQSFSELLDSIALFHEKIAPKKHFFLITDQKSDYLTAVSQNPTIQNLQKNYLFSHTRIPGRAPRTLENPMFPVNYLDMLFRKDLSEHGIKTICFCRNVNNQMARLAIYRFYHNYLKKFRVRDKVFSTHSDKTGIPQKIRDHAIRQFYSERVFLTHDPPMETDMKIIKREYETPLMKKNLQFDEKWCA
jgi:transposase-like protein